MSEKLAHGRQTARHEPHTIRPHALPRVVSIRKLLHPSAASYQTCTLRGPGLQHHVGCERSRGKHDCTQACPDRTSLASDQQSASQRTHPPGLAGQAPPANRPRLPPIGEIRRLDKRHTSSHSSCEKVVSHNRPHVGSVGDVLEADGWFKRSQLGGGSPEGAL